MCILKTQWHIDFDSCYVSSSIDAFVSLANIWANEALAKYQAQSTKSEKACSLDILSSANTVKDKSAIIEGRKRGAVTLQNFDMRWDNARDNSRA